LAQLLKRINPLLADAQRPEGDKGLARISITALNLPLAGPPEDAEATARISFPALQLSDHPSDFARQLQMLLGTPARARIAPGLLRVRLEDGTFSYDNFVVNVERARANFSGQVWITGGGHLDLVAVIPTVSAGLSSGTTEVVIGGTVDQPVVGKTHN
jgi:hypothetical protein